MYKSKVLMSFVPIIYISFIVCLLFNKADLALKISALLSPAITVLYFSFVKKRTIPVSLFLIFFSTSDIMVLFADYISYELNYFIGNALYVCAYFSLIFEICKSTCIAHILQNLKVHVFVLTALNIYIVYVLQVIVTPHLSPLSGEYIMELIYNVVMLVLLSLSLLNFFHRDDKKSLFLFIGSLCIVFAEVLGVAYLYVTNEGLLNFISTTLFLLAFYILFWQSKVRAEEPRKLLIEEF
ncbi:hypothetical protein [Aestuariivivens sediminicola]|uniref:hypothetical protein n=1 Tax=Aestuariivivens sediminicola TaxID=2913560 RepID=UPI001F584042|nr:hypothetical protein [Aestuariivivens sediminicola]